MITYREDQGKPITPAAAVNGTPTEISIWRLRRFLDETVGDVSWNTTSTWVGIISPSHDCRFVDALKQAFKGIPLRPSDTVTVSFSRDEPRLWSVDCGQLRLVCVFAPRNGAGDDCAIFPLWSCYDVVAESPAWLFTFDADAVVRAIEELTARRARWTHVGGAA